MLVFPVHQRWMCLGSSATAPEHQWWDGGRAPSSVWPPSELLGQKQRMNSWSSEAWKSVGKFYYQTLGHLELKQQTVRPPILAWHRGVFSLSLFKTYNSDPSHRDSEGAFLVQQPWGVTEGPPFWNPDIGKLSLRTWAIRRSSSLSRLTWAGRGKKTSLVFGPMWIP